MGWGIDWRKRATSCFSKFCMKSYLHFFACFLLLLALFCVCDAQQYTRRFPPIRGSPRYLRSVTTSPIHPGFVNPYPAGLGGFRRFQTAPTPINREIKVLNNCSFPVWFHVSGTHKLPVNKGAVLNSGASSSVLAARGWTGKIWPRTDCDEISSCTSGRCEHNGECTGGDRNAVISSAYFSFYGGSDVYKVSMEQGYSIPILIDPTNAHEKCKRAGECSEDVNKLCPDEFAVKRNGTTVACRSECHVFRTDEACCRGDYQDKCRENGTTILFRRACPNSWMHDNPKRFRCRGAQYTVQFC